MGAIDDIYAELDTDVPEEEFREAVAAKVEQMGGLADEETAAMLIAHELADQEVSGIADVEPGMNEVKFLGKIVSVGELREFERDGEDEPGQVINFEVADETGSIRVTFWDEQATAAAEELDQGHVLRIQGRPQEGYNGVEVSVDRAEPDDVDIDIMVVDVHQIDQLSLGLSDVNLRGKVLDTDTVRTFDRDDGSEGRVANLTLGDETGRLRVTLWDDKADLVETFEPGESVEVVDGYVRDRDDDLELHVGRRGTIEAIEDDVTYVPDTTDVADLEIGRTVDIAGVVRSADPVRTFDRDDGSEGQVRNIRVQDTTGDIRVALWGEKADLDLAPGDEIQLGDVEIKDGWQEDLEASVGWRSTVVVLDDGSPRGEPGDAAAEAGVGLDAFADGEAPSASADDAADADVPDEGDSVEFTGVVVQTGDPVVLDDGEETMSVETGADLELGQEVTVRGRLRDGRLDADELV